MRPAMTPGARTRNAADPAAARAFLLPSGTWASPCEAEVPLDGPGVIAASSLLNSSAVEEETTDAGVDVALVTYHFGSKDGLFAAALEMPAPMAALMADVFEQGEVADFGER